MRRMGHRAATGCIPWRGGSDSCPTRCHGGAAVFNQAAPFGNAAVRSEWAAAAGGSGAPMDGRGWPIAAPGAVAARRTAERPSCQHSTANSACGEFALGRCRPTRARFYINAMSGALTVRDSQLTPGPGGMTRELSRLSRGKSDAWRDKWGVRTGKSSARRDKSDVRIGNASIQPVKSDLRTGESTDRPGKSKKRMGKPSVRPAKSGVGAVKPSVAQGK